MLFVNETHREKHIIVLLLLILPRIVIDGQQARPPTAQIPKPSTYAAPGVSFTEATKAAGLGGFRFVSGTAAKDYLPEAMGAGVAFVDYDNDGWLDVYLVNGATIDFLRGKAKAPRAALYRNNRDGTFSDVTDQSDVANDGWGQGVCAGDFDNDGWTDLYVTNLGKNRLYRNNRNGSFTDIAEKAGVACGGWSTGAAFGDYDGDGLLDLYAAGYVDFDLDRLPPPATGSVQNVGDPAKGKTSETNGKGIGAAYQPGMSYCQYRNQRVMCGPRGLKGAPDFLFRNNGDGTFTDVTKRAGVEDKSNYYGFGVAWFDMDDDGRLDLAVANDSTPSYLYRNNGDGTFEDVSYQSGTALNEQGREQAGMGIAIGDYDGDGRNDIHRTNFADDSNVLYRNDGKGDFTETTFQTGIGEVSIPFLGWGTNFFDYDNDRLLDLFVANGHIFPTIAEANAGSSYKQRLLLFRNVGNSFYEVGSSAGDALYTPRSSRGSAVGDYDNDGDLDILLGNLDDAPSLLRNDGANRSGRWLKLKLVGDVRQKCPKDAIGTVVFCHAGGRRMREEVASGRSLHSQSDLRVHFGLGATAAVDKLEVRWMNGKTEEYRIKVVDQVVTIEQGRGIRN